jgi:hypothetical protein
MPSFTCFPGRLAGAAAMAGAAALAPAAALAVPAAADAMAAPHLIGCHPSESVRPSSFNPICNDGAGTAIKLRWSRWSGSAEGTGEFYTHSCVPDCAQGKVALYRVSLSAGRVRGSDYTRLRYSFPGRVPPGLSRSWVISYAGHQWHGQVV